MTLSNICVCDQYRHSVGVSLWPVLLLRQWPADETEQEERTEKIGALENVCRLSLSLFE